MKVAHAAYAFLLLLIAQNASALTIEHQSVCKVVATSDVTLSLRIRSAEDLCGSKGWKCSGIVYTAVPKSGRDGPALTFISSERLEVGSAYMIFANRVQEGEQISLSNPDYSSYPMPKGVDYYVHIGYAFGFNGSSYYRELPGLCVGDGKDCLALTSLLPVRSGPIVSANVTYPDLEKELLECPR